MEHTKFSAPQDMEVGPDGRLYVLEYGSGWFTKNPDAGISRIDFNSGNRPPKIAGLRVDKETGVLPFKVTASVEAKDPETKDLTYIWDFGNGTKKETQEPVADVTYTAPGDYGISVTVSDDEKAASKSEVITVYAGNETPEVDINVEDNQSIYFPGKPLAYQVNVKDDAAGSAQPAGLQVIADFVEGRDKAAVPPGHLSVSETMMGRSIMLSLDCKACHQETAKSVGPAYVQVAEKYRKDKNAIPYLVDKIKKGGAGVWGEVAMSAHPDVPEKDLEQIAKWIMSLGNAQAKKSSLPPSGSISPSASEKRTLYLTATYTDEGAAGIKPLTGKQTLVLKSNLYTMREARQVQGFTRKDTAGTRLLELSTAQGSFLLDSIDVKGLSAAELKLTASRIVSTGYRSNR
jgi:cytochrome c551/c552